MAGYEAQREALLTLGASIVAASVDDEENARKIADTVSFPVGYGVTRDMADRIGAWWEERRGIIQPSEFILDRDGRVRTSTYSSGPVGRIAADAAVRWGMSVSPVGTAR